MPPSRHSLPKSLRVLNGLIAAALLAYGWVCWKSDTFLMPRRHGSDWTMHGASCQLMVGVLVCGAFMLLLNAIHPYLNPIQQKWNEKARTPLAGLIFALFAAAMVVHLVSSFSSK